MNTTGRPIKHGMFGTPVYAVWVAMLQRCHNPQHHAYGSYGARGIKVCERWKKFENFFADMGNQPAGLTLERKKNDQGYHKENCCWATRKEQANNRRSCRLLTHAGRTLNVTQWAEHLRVPRMLIYDRLKAGWPVSRALTEPKRGKQ